MKTQSLAVLAALLLSAAPAAAQSAEVELHIEASAQIPPDSALVPLTVRSEGATAAQALAGLVKEEKRVKGDLAKLGIAAARIAAVGEPRTAPGEAAACAAADAAAKAAEAAAEAASDAAEAAADCGEPARVVASRTLLVTVEKPDQIEAVIGLGAADYDYSDRRSIVHSQSDPAAARSKARGDALAKARAEADAYADAMGYRVVRVVRISNAKPPVSLQELISFFVTLDDRTMRRQPSWFGATITESVAVDYVIAPK
ncbi:MAG TPA: SIMPL domain-containing protein [Novosphingobium sp.]|nr:SIMPL domain-containing protein [Novosphingobium sp.]HQA17895.1 SIMPL domain-containing protein [Novosphingobium sp.]